MELRGTTAIAGRIISGIPIEIEDAPYQVSIQSGFQHMCGGALVTPLVVLTAAHCLIFLPNRELIQPFELSVRTGSSVANSGGTVHDVNRVVLKPGFSTEPDSRDLGLILLQNAVEVGKKTRPISVSALPPADGEMAYITGYGSQNVQLPRYRQAGHLMAVKVPIYPRNKCYNIMLDLGAIVATDMICAGYDSDHRDACKGDSGGPMVVDDRLVGITAWGVGCGQRGLPGVYTSIAPYIDWIVLCMQQIAQGGICDKLQPAYRDRNEYNKNK